MKPFGQHPAQARSSGSGLRGAEGRCGESRAAAGAAAVEAEPAEPKQAGAREREDHAIGLRYVGGVANALAEDEDRGKPGKAGRNVDHGAAREVNGADAAVSRQL